MATIGQLMRGKSSWREVLDSVMPGGIKWYKSPGDCKRACPHFDECNGYGPGGICTDDWRRAGAIPRNLRVLLHVLSEFDHYNRGDKPGYARRSAAIVQMRRTVAKELDRQLDEPPPKRPARKDRRGVQKYARQVRQGQRPFRERMLWLYSGRCAVSGCAVESVLEAAHILPYVKGRLNTDGNGILLRSDIHYLFDDELLRIRPRNLQIAVDRSLKGSAYWRYNNRTLRARRDGSRPALTHLTKRWQGQKQ